MLRVCGLRRDGRIHGVFGSCVGSGDYIYLPFSIWGGLCWGYMLSDIVI